MNSASQRDQLGRALALFILDFAFIFSIGTVLLITTANCGAPIRSWLYGLLCGFVYHFFLTCFMIAGAYTTKRDMPWMTMSYYAMHIPLVAFFSAWFVLGNVWLFSDTTCSNFQAGFWMAATYLVLLGLMMIAVLALFVYVMVLYVREGKAAFDQLRGRLTGHNYEAIH